MLVCRQWGIPLPDGGLAATVVVMGKRLALMGGTFDPVHLGHLITARAVAEAMDFPQVLLVPAASPPHKPGPKASPAQRLEMLRRAVEGDERLGICTAELFREGASYTRDTLADLRAEHGPETELYWVIGADMLATLDTWHKVREVLSMARIVVAARPPWDQQMDEIFLRLEERLGQKQISQIKKFTVQTPLIDISSSQIRRRVADGRSIRHLIPDSVISYIDQSGLYR